MPTTSSLAFTLGPVQLDEHALVLDSWMRSCAPTRRAAMVRVLRSGHVVVARSPGGLALGWIAVDETGALGWVWVKSTYRRLGLAHALLEAVGSPKVAAGPWPRRAAKLARAVGIEVRHA